MSSAIFWKIGIQCLEVKTPLLILTKLTSWTRGGSAFQILEESEVLGLFYAPRPLCDLTILELLLSDTEAKDAPSVVPE